MTKRPTRPEDAKPETRAVCPACGQIEGAHLKHCRIAKLTEENAALRRALQRRVYLDCDGVLADFDAAFAARFGHPPRSYEATHGSKVFWENIRDDAPDFYRTLPLMPQARELFQAVEHLRPIILTGCPMGGWAEPQKLAWAAEHFPGTPMIVCMSKDKRHYCKPGDVLIDDYLKYRDLWEQAGGTFIHFTGDVTEARACLAAISGEK